VVEVGKGKRARLSGSSPPRERRNGKAGQEDNSIPSRKVSYFVAGNGGKKAGAERLRKELTIMRIMNTILPKRALKWDI